VGWAIIVLTVLINVLILPFRVKTMQSALKMQRIQPQMDAIKEKYKKFKVTDPKRNEMNAEIMQLQKDNGVNMFGGCIPTLITMPLLFAFFTMLPRVVELREAHWFWLPNLQQADPYHILPIVDGGVAVPGAVLHAFTGRRPTAAEDDGVHDAGLFRVHHLVLRIGAGAVLDGGQPDRHRAAGGDESHFAGAGDARDCFETRTPQSWSRHHPSTKIALDPMATMG